MFAGPNGSGKSTLKTVLPADLLGVYINTDDIERCIHQCGYLDFEAFGVQPDGSEVSSFFNQSPLIRNKGLAAGAERLSLVNGRIFFDEVHINGYYAAAIADFIRVKLLGQKVSFTFETVMSHPSKVEILKLAQALGYRTYLYYIATDDPEINVSRVRYRVSHGGHDVPEDKIRSRYSRSLDLLMMAIRNTNRAYIWDNSGHDTDSALLAEITEGRELELKTSQIPAWFKKAVWDKIQQS